MAERKSEAGAGDMLEDWLRVLERLPFVSSIKRDLTSLRRLLYDRRPPRIAAVGADGAGRTALANAMLGADAFAPGALGPEAGRWVRVDAEGRRLSWLELPTHDDDAASELGWRAFEDELPDLLVGVIAVGAEAAEGARLATTLAALQKQLEVEHSAKPAVLIVLTKADTLAPPDAMPPYPSDKRTAIDLSLETVRRETRSLGLAAEAYLAVAAAPLASEGASQRWELDRLGEAMLDRLPEAAQLEAARAFEVGREARRRVARALVNSCSALAVTVGLAPIPFADAFVLLPLQGAMVTGVAYLSGRSWDRRAALEWIASVGFAGGAGMGLRWGAQQLVKLVPGAGTIVGAGVAGAGTLAIGRSAIAYFLDGPSARAPRKELRADNPA